MAHKALNRRKFSLLTSTALTGQAAALGALSVVFGASSAFALDPNALPQDPNVVGGAASFHQSGATLNVNQSTNRTVIDWRSFDIGSNATTNFIQPGASSIAVNRINSSTNPTEIQGSLNANGQVWILNPNGVLFGKTAKIDVAGIVASTGNINTDAFMRGDNRLTFTGADGGKVVNDGLISVADGGLAAFVAPSVRNSGIIRARVGKVTLAAGTTFTLDLAGDQLVELGLGANEAIVDQNGQVLADGSVVNITAKAATEVVDSVINVSGTILASSAYEDGGTIVLTADNITTSADAVLKADAGTNGEGGTIYGYADKLGKYDGTFSAQGGSQSGDGGFIETSGKKVQIADGISIDTRAANGKTGNWTIDPDDLTVGGVGADVAVSTVVTAMNTTGLTLTANNSITVNEEINSSGQTSATTLALNDENSDDNLTINLNDKIILGANQHLTGQGTTVNVASTGIIQNGVDVASTSGATVNVAAGEYDAGTKISKNGITLAGADGAKINVGVGEQGVNINANDVTLTGFEIAGPVVGDQATLDWNTAGSSYGVFVTGKSNSNVTISNNNIHDVRTGILIANSGANGGQDTTLADAASGSITDNVIENTKGAILVQYRDGHTFNIDGNSEGVNGNEWGIVTGLQNTKINSDPSLARQQQILAWANTNNGMTVMDRQYATSNRSEVTVDATGTATAADDFNLGNGVGNERQPINNIQSGVDAVVTGGTVNVAAGTYNENVTINKSGINLLSNDGRDVTTIVGQNGGAAQGAVYVKSGANNFRFGDIDHGFTVIGLDGTAASERSAVYFQGANSGSTIRGNRITAAGDEAILTEYGGAIANLTIDSNTIDGVTFVQPTAGNGAQFVAENVPRGLVYIAGAGGANKTNIVFTNNDITGTAGGYALDGSQSGNTLVTIDAAGATITGNTFAGTTTKWADALRARGSDTVISGNTFDGTNMASGTNMAEVNATTLSGTFADFIANNTWNNGSAWVDHAVGGVYYVFRGVQNAINGAIAGDTVNVGAGTYDEAVAINKGLTLQGADSSDRAQLKNGITFSGTFSDLTLKNLYVTNDTPAATRVIGGSTSITNLTLDNVAIDGQNIATQHGFSGGQYGGNISITNSQFLNIGNWSAFDTRSGAGGPGAGTSIISVVFSNNLIDNVKGGITFRQQDGGVFGDVTISDNIVQNIGSTANSTGGIFKIFNADTVDFSGNTISDIGTNGSVSSDGVQYGAALLARGVNTLNVTDNSFTNVHMAVAVEKANAAPGQTTFTNNTFDNNGYAFFMPGDALNGGNVTFGAGNEINSGADTVQDIVWRNSNALDLTNVKFDGKLGSEMTDAELFALEDLITHGTDLASSGLATVKAGNVYVTTNSGSIQRGADKSAAGDTVNIGNGTYVVNSANGYTHGRLEITKSVNLVGQSEAGTIIDGRGAATYGLRVVTGADNVSLSNFTVLGVGATNGYGIKVEDVQNFSIDHVTSHGAYKAQLDLNGVRGGTVDHVTADGTSNGVGTGSVKGAAIAITDSQNVTITNSSTNNGSYGGIAIYQSNKPSGYSYQTKDITIAASNTYGEANPVYMEDESATNNFGTVNVAGFDYIARNTNPADAYTWFQKTQQGAIDAAVLAAGYVEGWLGSAGNNVFTVGTSGGNAMSINAATNAAADNATINVLSGTYGAFGTSFGGASDVTIQTAHGAIIDGTGQTGRIVDLRADGTTLTGFTINGDGTGVGVSVSGQNVKVIDNTIDGTLTGVQTTTQYPAGNATISGNTINTAHGISLQNTGNTVSNNNVTASAEGVGLLEGDNTFTGNTFDIGAGGNALALYGTASANDLNASGNTVTIAGGGLQGAVDLTGAGGNLNVNGGTYAEDVVVGGASRNISFVGATLDKFTTNTATAIGGTVSAVNGFFLNAATTLLSNTVLNGSVTATSIDGSTAGGQTLTVNGGNNALGSLGATTRLGATSISGTTTLAGDTYAANALSFAGPVTLTQSLTTFDTTISPSEAGNITFTGSIFGTTDGAQNVAFIAGPGTGAASANGDISLQNAGTDALWLGSMSATGDDFSAATVYVGGSYNSTLTGNQTFTSTTLHTRGSVTSNVGGNATGPIVSNGNVNVTTGGNFNGNVTAPTGTIQGQTITGTFTGGAFTFIASQNIDVDVNANSINVSAPSGTVDGTFTTISNTGGPIVVNGQTRTGDNGANLNQIVVEGYTLPAGSIVTPSGEIILPSGMVIGLISPQAGLGAEGGKPKVIVVHSVQRLGELLAQGYVAIIVDLSKNSDETEEIALAD